MERNKLFIQPFEFSEFLNTKWDNFLGKILSEAHHKSAEDAEDAAYSMGGGEVPAMRFLPGEHTGDQKYLTQFHPNAMAHALHRRLGKDLLRIGQHWDVHRTLPEGLDRADQFDVEDKKVGRPKKEDTGRTFVRRYKHVLSDILNDEEYTGLDEDQKKAYDEAMADPTKHTKVQDPDTGEMIDKLMLKIYSGHSHLAKRLSNPAKVIANQHKSENSKFKPGIGLNDITMLDKDKNIIGPDHPDYPEFSKKVKEYLDAGHGFYDFDLSDVTLVPKEKFIDMDDEHIVNTLEPKWKKLYDTIQPDYKDNGEWKNMPEYNEEGMEFKTLAKKIENKRLRGIKDSGDSMSGFEPIKAEKATTLLTDWIRANALGILGPRAKDGDVVKDPVTGKMVKVYMMPYEQAVKYFGRNLIAGYVPKMTRSGTKGKKAHPGEVLKLDIPVIPRWVSYENLRILFPDGVNAGDPEGGNERANPPVHGEKIWVPYLHDAKTIAKIRWTPEQKAILAHREEPELLPGFEETKNDKLTDLQITNLLSRYKDAISKKDNKGNPTEKAKTLLRASTSLDIGKIINNWDLLSPEQRDEVVKNSRTLVQNAKAMHGGIETADIYSHGGHNHGVGYTVNKASPEIPYIGINEDQVKLIKNKYGERLYKEATEIVNRWFFGEREATLRNKAAGSAAAQMLSTLTPSYVKEAWIKNQDDLVAIITIYITAMLNDYKMGIYDPDRALGLDSLKNDKIMKTYEQDPMIGGKNLRMQKAKNLLESLAQAQKDNIPPKRHRANARIEVQAGTDKEGRSLENEKQDSFEQLQKWQDKRITGMRRMAKAPEGLLTSAKSVLGNVPMPEIVASIRSMVKKQLGDADLTLFDRANHRLNIAANVRATLTAQLDAEYASKKDDNGLPYTSAQRENLVDSIVNDRITDELKKQNKELFSNMTDEERELLITALKSKGKSEMAHADFDFDKDNPDYVEQFERAMTGFWGKIIRNKSAGIPEYNKKEKEFVDSNNIDEKISLQNFQSGHNAIGPAEFIKMMKGIYDATAKEATSRTKGQVHQNLEKWAPIVYEELLKVSSNNKGLTRTEITGMLKAAGMGAEETYPIQQPATAQPATAQPATAQPATAQPATAQPQMAANVVDDALTNITKYVGKPDFITLVDQLAARAVEFSTSPNRKEIGEKIRATCENIAKVRKQMHLSGQLQFDMDEGYAFNKLKTLYKNLIA